MIYFIKNLVNGAIKIGFSVKPQKRLSALQTASPHKLALLGTVPGKKADEPLFHARFAKCRLHGEWFDGAIIEEVLEIIEAHKKHTREIRRKTVAETTDGAVVGAGTGSTADERGRWTRTPGSRASAAFRG